jgi:hypothetical protein
VLLLRRQRTERHETASEQKNIHAPDHPSLLLPPLSPSPPVAKIALTSAPRWHHIIIKQLIDEESCARYP